MESLYSALAETPTPQCHVINDVSGAAIFHPDSSTQTFTIPALLAHRLPQTINKKVAVFEVIRRKLRLKLADVLIQPILASLRTHFTFSFTL